MKPSSKEVGIWSDFKVPAFSHEAQHLLALGRGPQGHGSGQASPCLLVSSLGSGAHSKGRLVVSPCGPGSPTSLCGARLRIPHFLTSVLFPEDDHVHCLGRELLREAGPRPR
jgi:hypothetical protein